MGPAFIYVCSDTLKAHFSTVLNGWSGITLSAVHNSALEINENTTSLVTSIKTT